MADSTPPRPKPTAAPRQPAGREPSEAEPALPGVRVTYYRRMKRQRVYSVTVGWDKRRKERPPAAAEGVPVIVRLIMAGAQVLPSERVLDPFKPDDRATFFVTPLARGWLRGETLEVLVGGRKVRQVRLRAKVVSQRPTWVLLALTFLVPWFLLTYFKYSPLQDPTQTPGRSLEERIRENLPELPAVVDEKAPAVRDTLLVAPENFGNFYEVACKYVREQPVAFYATLVLLVLTLLSWFCHRERSKRVRTAPLPLLVRESAESPAAVRRTAGAVE
jgi:hypothetical protein